ncbi:MAG: hypothetical protein QG671_780, partial [Actinomycetota bacterium]|nr:hypothetical protein [Actinomycetota bacterium]
MYQHRRRVFENRPFRLRTFLGYVFWDRVLRPLLAAKASRAVMTSMDRQICPRFLFVVSVRIPAATS